MTSPLTNNGIHLDKFHPRYDLVNDHSDLSALEKAFRSLERRFLRTCTWNSSNPWRVFFARLAARKWETIDRLKSQRRERHSFSSSSCAFSWREMIGDFATNRSFIKWSAFVSFRWLTRWRRTVLLLVSQRKDPLDPMSWICHQLIELKTNRGKFFQLFQVLTFG